MSLSDKLVHERRGRLAAERLLELKQAELFSANAKLGEHALELSDQIVEQRQEVAFFREEAEVLKDENSQVRSHLEVAEQRLWNSVQTINDGFAVFDANNCLVTANDSFVALFDGLEEIQAGVTYGRVLELLAEEGTVDVGSQPAAEWQAEMLERWHEAQLEPLTIKLWDQRFIRLIDRRGANGDTVTLALDITEATQREEDLKDARNRAEAASRAKSSFLANMSHELRTPMNGVVGMAELLRDGQLDDEQKLFVDTIVSSGEALLAIINDVLDYSKVEAGKLQLHPENFNLRRTIDEVCTLLRPTTTEKGLALNVRYEDDVPNEFFADPGRIRQVLINLLGNAIKFTNEGKVELRLSGYEAKEPGQLIVSAEIEDTGVGIHEDQLDHIFGEFNQAEDEHNRNFDGTGLGLAITRELVQLMGGDIWVESEPGKGSCFGFKVPMSVTGHSDDISHTPPDQLPLSEPGAPDTVTPELRKMRVLAAEDNKTNRLVFSKMVKSLNIELRFAENGIEALDLWRSFEPDLIFMDISMPKMDGKEATAKIRRGETEADMPPVPVVAVTAHAMEGDDEAIMAAGVSHYLTKPLRKPLILAQIHAALPENCEGLE